MPNLQLQEKARLTGLRLFLWRNLGFPSKQGLFLFHISNKQSIRGSKDEYFTVNFELSLLRQSNSDFQGMLKNIISKSPSSSLLTPNAIHLLAQQVSDYIHSSFRFHTTRRPTYAHRLVLVFLADCRLANPLPYSDDSAFYLLNNHIHIPSFHSDDDDEDVLELWERIRALTSERSRRRRLELTARMQRGISSSELDDDDNNEEELRFILSVLKPSNYYPTCLSVQKRLSKVKQTAQFKQEEEEEEVLLHERVCSICLGEMKSCKEEEIVKVVRCSHLFPRDCLFKWLPQKQMCPYCRSSTLANVYL